MVVVPQRNAHVGLLVAVIGQCSARLQTDLVEFSAARVAIEETRYRIVSNINVRVPSSC